MFFFFARVLVDTCNNVKVEEVMKPFWFFPPLQGLKSTRETKEADSELKERTVTWPVKQRSCSEG